VELTFFEMHRDSLKEETPEHAFCYFRKEKRLTQRKTLKSEMLSCGTDLFSKSKETDSKNRFQKIKKNHLQLSLLMCCLFDNN
jgi:hypothetical protein